MKSPFKRTGGAKGLPEQLDALAGALDMADGRLDPAEVAAGRAVVDKASERLRHGTTNTLVALLGATGSGKSSVANALAGSDVATAGVRRPTTSSTLGIYWPDNRDQPGTTNAQALLDWLEIKNRHFVDDQNQLEGLVLLDVPDHDSVQVEHRMEMERIAEHADLLLWVTDAEKYADKAMHDYLRRLGEHGAVTAMVLNKADLLTPEEVKHCVSDMGRLLAADGLPKAPVVPVSAVTGQGIDQLRSVVAEAVGEQKATVERLAADVRTTATALIDRLGPEGGTDKVPTRVANTLAEELVGASGLEVVTQAVADGHRRDASAQVGWPVTRWARRLRPHPLRRLHLNPGSGGKATLPTPSGVQMARSEAAVRDATMAVTENLPDPWPEIVADAATPDQEALNIRIEEAITDSVRSINPAGSPRWWGVFNIVQLILVITALVGAGWLGALALGAYLRLPDIPTPNVGDTRIPWPTALLIGGLFFGFLFSLIGRQLASVGAKRRARAVRSKATEKVKAISDELVIEPMQAELDRRNELRVALVRARGSR